MKISQRSKAPLYIIENVSTSPLTARNVRRHQQTQGIALVVVLLSAMVLMVSMLAISATMAISSQRTTANQKSTLQAQYAAEAGLALAKTRAAEAFVLFPLISVPTNTTMAALQTAAVDFCGRAFDRSVNRATLSSPVRVCDNAGSNNGGTAPANRNYSIFVDYIANTAVTTAITAANTEAAVTTGNRDSDTIYLNTYSSLSTSAAKTTFWQDIFSGNTSRSSITLPSPGSGVTAAYTPTYGFIPYQVYAIPGGFRLTFTVAQIKSIATLRANGATVTTRTLTADPAMPRVSLDVARQCFCQYNYFANRRLTPAGTTLAFGANEVFYGKVHVNSSSTGAPYFSANSSTVYSDFYGGFSTTAASRNWQGTNYESTITKDAMFHNNHQFNAARVDMPENAASQKRAVIGQDPEGTTTFTDQTLGAAYGLNFSTTTPTPAQFPNGVYFGNGSKKGSSFAGGIYVRGNVKDIQLTVNASKKQVITIIQEPCPTVGTLSTTWCVATNTGITATTTTTFTQNTDNSWTLTEKVGSNTATTQAVSNSFNGLLFVDGNIGSEDSQVATTLLTGAAGGLGGEGTNDSAVRRNLDPATGIDANKSREKETPDIAKDIRITIAAREDIYIKRNLTYSDAPKDDDPNTAIDESTYNMLGIYSEQGDIKVDGVRNKSIKIDGTLMAVGTLPNAKTNTSQAGHGFGTLSYDKLLRFSTGARPTIELTGGIIEEQSQGVWSNSGSSYFGYDRDFDYDQRFANGKTPPFFPTQGQYTAACSEIALASYTSTLITGTSNPELPNTLRPCTRNSEDIWSPAKG